MTPKSLVRGALASALLALLTGCSPHKGVLIPVPANTDPMVFDDGFGRSVNWEPFLGSNQTTLAIDDVEHHTGTKSLRFDVFADVYVGGAFVTGDRPRDLSGYNALTFWAKADRPVTLAIAGLGNNNRGTSLYDASRAGLALTTTWTKYSIPIPVPTKLTSESGMFYFAKAPELCKIWIDDLRFEVSSTVGNPRANFPNQAITLDVGSPVTVSDTRAVFDIDGQADQIVNCSPYYFTFTAQDSAIAKNQDNRLTVVGPGTTTITAQMGGIPVTGTATLTAINAPTSAAPTPTLPAADVISLFSDAYTNVNVDTWSPDWDLASVSDVTIQGDHVKKYAAGLSPGNYAAVEFKTPTLGATAMTHFHIDVWVASGKTVRVKLVDFGADGAFGGGDDSEHETVAVNFTPHPGPPYLVLVPGQWNSFDIPFSSMTGLTSRAHLAQMLFKGADGNTFSDPLPPLYIDNVYLHR